MRSRFSRRVMGSSSLLVLAVAPLFGGCSTLGIAEVKNVDAMDTRLTQQNQTTSGRVGAVEQAVQSLDPRLQSLETAVQQLGAQQAANSAMMASIMEMHNAIMEAHSSIMEVHNWLKGLNIDAISRDTRNAAILSQRAKEHVQTITSRRLQRLQSQQEWLADEIAFTEGLLQPEPAGDDGSSQPAGGEGGGESSSGSD